MRIRFEKLDDTWHVLEVERGERRERVRLETRSTLHHDLTHLAVEEAAGLEDGFFGALARGATLAELAPGGRGHPPEYADAMLRVERAVAVLQRLAKVDEQPAALHARLAEALAIQGAALPSWFTVELVSAVRERLRGLVGHWRATPYGGVMELEWGAGERVGEGVAGPPDATPS